MSVLYLGTGVEKTKPVVLAKLKALTRQPGVTAVAPAPKAASLVGTPAGPVGRNDTRLAPPNLYEQNGMPPRSLMESGRPPTDYYGRPSVPLTPGPGADRNCVTLVQITNPYPSLRALLQHGGAAPVIYAGRLVIQVNYDYIASNHLRVLSRDDRTYITRRGPAIVDLGRVPVSELPSGSIEVIRGDRPICEQRAGHG
jgi:hypothetical protein